MSHEWLNGSGTHRIAALFRYLTDAQTLVQIRVASRGRNLEQQLHSFSRLSAINSL